ncbi:MAG: hypothetical protein ACYTFV_18375 [Planctomycetota bacterium]
MTRLDPPPERAPELVVWVFALFGPSLSGEYVADDYFLIDQVAGPGGGPDLETTAGFWMPAHGRLAPKFVRPVWRASYLVDLTLVRVGWGAPASRAIELLLHALCCWLLLRWWCSLGAPRSAGRLVAGLAVLAPVATGAVLWTAARCDLLAEIGVLAALTVRAEILNGALRPRSEAWIWIAMVVGMWSKETAAVGGVLLAMQEFTHPARVGLPARERFRLARGFIARGLVVALVLLGHRVWALGELVGGYEGQEIDLVELVSATGRNVSVLAFPISAALPLPLDTSSATALGGTVVALLAFVVLRSANPAVRLFSAWLLLSLLVLGGLNVDTLDAPHSRLLYQPFFAWIALVGLGLAHARGRVHSESEANPTARSAVQAAGVLLVVAGLAGHGPATSDFSRGAREMADFRLAFGEWVGARWDDGDAGRPAVIYGLPEFEGRAPVGLNVFPSIFEPPFLERVLGYLPDGPRYVGMTEAAALEMRPTPRELRRLLASTSQWLSWEEGELRPVRGVPQPEDPTLRREPLPVSVTGTGRAARFSIRDLEPGVGTGRAARFSIRDLEPGVVVAVLVGRAGEPVPLGAAGSVGVEEGSLVMVGTTDDTGSVEVAVEDLLSFRVKGQRSRLVVVALPDEGLRISTPLDL